MKMGLILTQEQKRVNIIWKAKPGFQYFQAENGWEVMQQNMLVFVKNNLAPNSTKHKTGCGKTVGKQTWIFTLNHPSLLPLSANIHYQKVANENESESDAAVRMRRWPVHWLNHENTATYSYFFVSAYLVFPAVYLYFSSCISTKGKSYQVRPSPVHQSEADQTRPGP